MAFLSLSNVANFLNETDPTCILKDVASDSINFHHE